jgi:hypothetical protein
MKLITIFFFILFTIVLSNRLEEAVSAYEKNLKKIKLGDEEIMELIQQLKKTIIESAPRMKEEEFEHSWKKTVNFEKMKIIEQKLFWNKIELDKIQGTIIDEEIEELKLSNFLSDLQIFILLVIIFSLVLYNLYNFYVYFKGLLIKFLEKKSKKLSENKK